MRAPGEAPGSFALGARSASSPRSWAWTPIELRPQQLDRTPPGHDLQWSSKHLDECFRVGADRFGWAHRPAGSRTDGDWLVGMGVATAVFPALRFPATVGITLRADDTAVVATGGADPGAGLLTVLSLVGAESLDIPADRIDAAARRLDPASPAAYSGGSTATASAGTAIMLAATKAIDELVAHGSRPGRAVRRRRSHLRRRPGLRRRASP